MWYFIICLLLQMAYPRPLNNTPWGSVVWIVIFIVTENFHSVVAETFNVHYLGVFPRRTERDFAAATIGLENYVRDHPNSTIFANHDVRYATAFWALFFFNPLFKLVSRPPACVVWGVSASKHWCNGGISKHHIIWQPKFHCIWYSKNLNRGQLHVILLIVDTYWYLISHYMMAGHAFMFVKVVS